MALQLLSCESYWRRRARIRWGLSQPVSTWQATYAERGRIAGLLRTAASLRRITCAECVPLAFWCGQRAAWHNRWGCPVYCAVYCFGRL